MKEKALILLEGYYKGYKKNEERQSTIIGILEPGTNIFKGIDILWKDCPTEDYKKLLDYIFHGYQTSQSFTLIAGHYDGKRLHYQSLLADKKMMTFGHFDQENRGLRLEGRERKSSNNGSLKRTLDRPVNRYNPHVLLLQVLSDSRDAEIRQCFLCLYELIEAILMRANETNLSWRGVQVAIESMDPSDIQNPNIQMKKNKRKN